MQNTSVHSNKHQVHHDIPQTQESPPVEVKRTFHAPPEMVWKAWSTPALVKLWWGPEGFSCPEAKLEFREGGKYLFAMKNPDGKVVWSGGVYEEISPDKLVYTDNFTDQRGHIVSAADYGMPGEWGETTRVTVEFEPAGEGQTKMRLKHEGIPADMHDDCVQGWTSTIDKMQRVVERHS